LALPPLSTFCNLHFSKISSPSSSSSFFSISFPFCCSSSVFSLSLQRLLLFFILPSAALSGGRSVGAHFGALKAGFKFGCSLVKIGNGNGVGGQIMKT
jgi:hypothetical protein